MKIPILLMALTMVEAEPRCYGGIDLMFCQDTTGSFIEDLPIVVAQLPSIVEKVNEQYPNSQFGVAEFKDKPYPPAGAEHEFCYKLGEGKLSKYLDDFWWAYSLLYGDGGQDLPEASFQALIDVALDKNVGWRPLVPPGTEPPDDAAAAHVVVLITDAPPHLPGDFAKIHAAYPGKYPELPASLPPNSGTVQYPEAIDYECIYEDYPDAFQVASALKSRNIFLIILTTDDPAITPAWRWFNDEALGQPPDFYQYIKDDSADLLEVLLSTLDRVTEHTCPTVLPTEAPSLPDLATETATTTVRSTFAISTDALTATVAGVTDSPCSCPECPCGPEVLVQIGDGPKVLHLEMEN